MTLQRFNRGVDPQAFTKSSFMRVAQLRLVWRASIGVILLCLMQPLSCNAWQEDVHYGLTKWLALQLGFSESEAEQLAVANQELDANMTDAIEAVCRSACLGQHHRPTAKSIGKHHFPDGDVPAPPTKRLVERNSKVVHERIATRLKAGGSKTNVLSDIGNELHALQDSWSHAGQPDVPPFCDENFVWTHPADRGGWRSTQADLTSCWQRPTNVYRTQAGTDIACPNKSTNAKLNDPLETASSTYKILQRLRGRQQGSEVELNQDLTEHVLSFAAAATKKDKKEWFKNHGFKDKDTEFVKRLSLPAGTDKVSELVYRLPDLPFKQFTQCGVSAGTQGLDKVIRYFDEFFDNWVKDTSSFEQLFDRDRVLASMVSPSSLDLARQWKTAFLLIRAWALSQDHGNVVKVLDTMYQPFSIADYHREAQAMLEGLQKHLSYERLNAENVTEALVPLPPDGRSYVLIELSHKEYAALAVFRHTPHHFVMVKAVESGRGWRTVAFYWFPVHPPGEM